jgi:hypothetical protein
MHTNVVWAARGWTLTRVRRPLYGVKSSDMVSDRNPRGSLSISDLELTAIIAHKEILVHDGDVRERTIWIASNNQAAASWSTKGSSTSVAARAYLLHYNALHQRCHRYLARHHYIPGPVNAMADDASRRWDLGDTQLLAHFNNLYLQETMIIDNSVVIRTVLRSTGGFLSYNPLGCHLI